MTDTQLYADRTPGDLEPHYSAHVAAMTAEGLHGKAEIAIELAFRDKELDFYKRENNRLYVDIEMRNTENARLRELLAVMLSKVNRDEIYKHDLIAIAMDGAAATEGCHTDVGTKLRLAIAARETEISELIGALEWCSGSKDFAPDGTARVGWEKVVVPLFRKHRHPTPQTVAASLAEDRDG
jgi:hypothetical protein